MVQYQGIVACSGGPDSMALLAKLCDKKVIVAHVNYHKRDTADRDEQIVRNFCDQHHLPLFVYAPKQEKAGNFQSWARQVRYDFFVELALKYHIDTIYVAHQKDDLLETYFFQKQRHMLCETYGLKVESMYKGIRICRPLL
ncbi:tRNA lysidine(34) synthetase TilS, partial [Faecalicoccus pleomorphus]|uniref:tRNA lysidine(34) synthetase TilS n=1 Tax=Faecalicoccus pleomorphus TaxID=1323 RepID=UPI0026EB4287